MNEMSLSSLYRRLVSERPQDDTDAAHSSLARMLRALRPESEALADKVNERRRTSHPVRQREPRVAAGARRNHVRWAGSIAASLAVVFGLLAWQGSRMQTHSPVASSTAPAPDRIFTTSDHIFASTDDKKQAGQARGDELFSGNFSSGG
ncbi:MAG: hypothetical protein ABIQ78_04670 [Dokdonella sp.]